MDTNRKTSIDRNPDRQTHSQAEKHTHTHSYTACIYIDDIGTMVRVFANGLGDLASIPGRVIPKIQKMVLDATLLNTQYYKVRIKGKVEQSKERSSALPLHLGVVAMEKGAFGSPSTNLANFMYIYIYIYICVCVYKVTLGIVVGAARKFLFSWATTQRRRGGSYIYIYIYIYIYSLFSIILVFTFDSYHFECLWRSLLQPDQKFRFIRCLMFNVRSLVAHRWTNWKRDGANKSM